MQLPALSRSQVRQIDKTAIETYGVPGIVLMENAGRGAAEIIAEYAPPGQVTILCGSGNNGGDGYVVARHLQLAGRDVQIVSVVQIDDLKGDAKTNALVAKRSSIPIRTVREKHEFDSVLSDAATIVDGLLGTGARGALRGPIAHAVEAANAVNAVRFALDIPTGIDCDTGETSGLAFQADHTLSFVAPKIGFEFADATRFIGTVHVIGIGAPKHLLDQCLLQKP